MFEIEKMGGYLDPYSEINVLLLDDVFCLLCQKSSV